MHGLIYSVSQCVPDKLYLQLLYYKHFQKLINFKNPQTFNEKLNWLKLYDRKLEYTQMVDKYAVREYIKEKIGETYLIPLLGVWNDSHDIDFEELPNQFVIKWNHDSGSVVICKDKSRMSALETITKLDSKRDHNGFLYGREWPYKDVPRKIIAEQYLENSEAGGLTDYKIHCFNGVARFVLVCQDRFSESGLKEDFYTPDWEWMPLKRPKIPNAAEPMPKPEKLEEMLALAQKLAKDIPFVRVDFYCVEGKLYFSELTFFPASGFAPFEPEEWDKTFGDWLVLPERNSI